MQGVFEQENKTSALLFEEGAKLAGIVIPLPLPEGATIGALLGIVAMSAGGGQGCNSTGAGCVGGAMLGYGLLGTFIDWQIESRRTVYKAP